jgi:hypothetical protein
MHYTILNGCWGPILDCNSMSCTRGTEIEAGFGFAQLSAGELPIGQGAFSMPRADLCVPKTSFELMT